MYESRIAGWRTWPGAFGGAAALILVPLWYRLPETTDLYSHHSIQYVRAVIPLIITCTLFVVLGFPGIRGLAAINHGCMAFSCLDMRSGCTHRRLAFRREADPALATGTAIQFAVVVVYAIAGRQRARYRQRGPVAALISTLFGTRYSPVIRLRFNIGWRNLGSTWRVPDRGHATTHQRRSGRRNSLAAALWLAAPSEYARRILCGIACCVRRMAVTSGLAALASRRSRGVRRIMGTTAHLFTRRVSIAGRCKRHIAAVVQSNGTMEPAVGARYGRGGDHRPRLRDFVFSIFAGTGWRWRGDNGTIQCWRAGRAE